MIIEDIASGLNTSDIMTKQTGRPLFARHVDNLSGRALIRSQIKLKIAMLVTKNKRNLV
jgi:hypothetical protein